MQNNKNRPAVVKSAAGKTNSKKDNTRLHEKEKAKAQRNAKHFIEEKQKERKQLERRSAEIQRKRLKASIKNQKLTKKLQDRLARKEGLLRAVDNVKNILKKVRFYVSREFLSSLDYKHILLCRVLPIIIVVVVIAGFSKTAFVNVPSKIRNYAYNGRIETDVVVRREVCSRDEQREMQSAIHDFGIGNFEFYISPKIYIDDYRIADEMHFGNSSIGNVVLIATIFDENGEILYRSLGLKSGEQIDRAEFFSGLSYGIHNVKIAVNAYNIETSKKIGTRYAKIQIAVGVDKNEKQ